MEQNRYLEAQQVFDALMVPYLELVSRIQKATAGEAVFVRAAMAAAGLPVGRSRLPSRDEAVTPEIRDGFRKLLAEARNQLAVADTSVDGLRRTWREEVHSG